LLEGRSSASETLSFNAETFGGRDVQSTIFSISRFEERAARFRGNQLVQIRRTRRFFTDEFFYGSSL
jgi:hypothetical protein